MLARCVRNVPNLQLVQSNGLSAGLSSQTKRGRQEPILLRVLQVVADIPVHSLLAHLPRSRDSSLAANSFDASRGLLQFQQ